MIKQLPEELINKIAAGEVVERPASVVKELVENSLDAGAREVHIDLLDGGKQSIIVKDNGRGIAKAEIPLALARHSTSKISQEQDLYRLTTMGFRGEALAAIASVSQLYLTSRTAEASEAWQVQLEGGEIVEQGPVGHSVGTTIQVKNLFFRTPARLKFLKSADTEITHIADYVTKAALAHPEVRLSLTHRGRRLIDVQGTDRLGERVRELFGGEIFSHTFDFSGGETVQIQGRLGHPLIARSHARQIYLFVNRRPVRDRMIQHGILEAYRDLLMKQRYPFIVLFIEVPSEMVDVNVHPAKAEVRFAKPNLIHNAILEIIREKLVQAPWKVPTNTPAPMHHDWERGPAFPCELDGAGQAGRHGDLPTDNEVYTALKQQFSEGPTVYEQRRIEFGHSPYAEMEVLGQLLGTYMVCQWQQKLVLVDQHAAHERIAFERLLKLHGAGNIPSQQLLVPINFDLQPSESEILKKYVAELSEFGFEIEFFGGHTFVVKSVPSLFGKLSPQSFVQDLIGDVLEKGRLASLHDQLHAVLARMACHGAVRANDPLTLPEMRALLIELDAHQNTSFCPHGRPVSIEVEKYEIEKWFKRVV